MSMFKKSVPYSILIFYKNNHCSISENGKKFSSYATEKYNNMHIIKKYLQITVTYLYITARAIQIYFNVKVCELNFLKILLP